MRKIHVSVVVRRMYYWDSNSRTKHTAPPKFQQLLEECTIGTMSVVEKLDPVDCFSSCQKNVLLGHGKPQGGWRQLLFQQLLEECTIGTRTSSSMASPICFSSCQKNVLLGPPRFRILFQNKVVSVVVRRMYYWDKTSANCPKLAQCFSSCQKNVLLGHWYTWFSYGLPLFQQLLEECTIGTVIAYVTGVISEQFQQLLEECTIGTRRIPSYESTT